MKKVIVKKGSKVLAKGVFYLDSPDERSWGMMFSNKRHVILAAEWEGKLNTSIHTFFCRPLLVAWINSKNKVVDVQVTRPWNLYFPKRPAKYVFETTDLKMKIKEGENIRILSQMRS